MRIGPGSCHLLAVSWCNEVQIDSKDSSLHVWMLLVVLWNKAENVYFCMMANLVCKMYPLTTLRSFKGFLECGNRFVDFICWTSKSLPCRFHCFLSFIFEVIKKKKKIPTIGNGYNPCFLDPFLLCSMDTTEGRGKFSKVRGNPLLRFFYLFQWQLCFSFFSSLFSPDDRGHQDACRG